MDKETYTHWLDASWEDFRRQLLQAYPENPAAMGVSSKRTNRTSSSKMTSSSRLSSHSDDGEPAGCALFKMPVAKSETDLTGDMPDELDDETPKDAKMMIEMVSDVPEVGGKQSEQGEMQTCLKSGLEGLSYQEAHAIRNRLRLRLNAIRADALVTGSGLHTAVASLGLTKYSVEDMNDFVNLLSDFINLRFEEEEVATEEEDEEATNSYTSIAALFSEQRGKRGPHAKLKVLKPVWSWPTTDEAKQSAAVSLRRSVTATTGNFDSPAGHRGNNTPAKAIMEVFLAKEGNVHKQIFGSKRLAQFRAMKEILLAGDTNRLVAELTFVRINDLASPPEAVDPLVYIEPLVALLIIGNGIMIGLQTDPANVDWDGWLAFEITFAVVLWVEIIFRIRMLRCFDYWCGTERYWNWFDLLLGVTGVADILLQIVSNNEVEIGGAGLLRFCRLIRLVRIVKVFRIKMLKDLRLMIKGLVAGIKTLSLAFMLLFAVLYVIAGFMTISIGQDPITQQIGLDRYFDTIPATMFTAFRCFNGECVTEHGHAIPFMLSERFGLPFQLAYVASYMLVTMGIFNVILAVYVDITMRAAKENDVQTAEAYSRESIRIARTTRELLKRFVAAYHAFIDMEENGTPAHKGSLRKLPSAALLTEDLMTDINISKELFLLVIQDKKIQRLMDELDLPPDRANLFEVIDADGSGTLEMAELLHGLLKIRGEVNKSDTVASYLATKAVQNMVSELKEETTRTVKEMKAKLFQQMMGLENKLDAMEVTLNRSDTSYIGSSINKSISFPSAVRERSTRSTPSMYREPHNHHTKPLGDMTPSVQPGILGDLDAEATMDMDPLDEASNE